MFRGGLCQSGNNFGISIGIAHAVLECVVERREKLESSLDARVLVPHFADALERLVI